MTDPCSEPTSFYRETDAAKTTKLIQTYIQCMVKHIHATLDDDDHERVEAVKDELGVTWEEFIIQAAEQFEVAEDE